MTSGYITPKICFLKYLLDMKAICHCTKHMRYSEDLFRVPQSFNQLGASFVAEKAFKNLEDIALESRDKISLPMLLLGLSAKPIAFPWFTAVVLRKCGAYLRSYWSTWITELIYVHASHWLQQSRVRITGFRNYRQDLPCTLLLLVAAKLVDTNIVRGRTALSYAD